MSEPATTGDIDRRNFDVLRRIGGRRSINTMVGERRLTDDARVEFLRDAMPRVHGYLLGRCGDRVVADDLLQETLLAAARQLRVGSHVTLSVPWLLSVAHNKYVDHVRRAVREERARQRSYEPDADRTEDEELFAGPDSRERTLTALATLSPAHRGVLVLHYLDGVPVAEVADHIGRSVHATESLLARARHAFGAAYRQEVRIDD